MASGSNVLQRYLHSQIREDLEYKMVFLGGPRQVGKTTLALDILGAKDRRHPAYLNWDSPHARKRLMDSEIPGGQPLLVLDEIHKFSRWRNLVKGFFDTRGEGTSFLVTGSARLDHYRKGGDSLQGRYHHYRLHPFSLGELTITPNSGDLETLMRFGGFPEPLLAGDSRAWRRWQRERMSRVVYEDLRDLENLRQVALVELLVEALPDRVENLVAGHLLKYCHFLEDTGGFRMELRFIRDTDRREVDFVVLKDRRPLFAVECKSGEKSPSRTIGYFRERTDIPEFYQVHPGARDYVASGTRVMPFATFCRELGLP